MGPAISLPPFQSGGTSLWGAITVAASAALAAADACGSCLSSSSFAAAAAVGALAAAATAVAAIITTAAAAEGGRRTIESHRAGGTKSRPLRLSGKGGAVLVAGAPKKPGLYK